MRGSGWQGVQNERHPLSFSKAAMAVHGGNKKVGCADKMLPADAGPGVGQRGLPDGTRLLHYRPGQHQVRAASSLLSLVTVWACLHSAEPGSEVVFDNKGQVAEHTAYVLEGGSRGICGTRVPALLFNCMLRCCAIRVPDASPPLPCSEENYGRVKEPMVEVTHIPLTLKCHN